MVERVGRLSLVIFALSAVVLASCGADSAVPPKVEAIQLNQYGFQPSSPKTAIIVTDAEAEQNWSLRNASGVVLYEGKARLFGRNAPSGRTVQQIDFSSLTTPGEGYYLYVNGVKSAPFKVDKDLYRPLKYDALNFFYQQRAGVEIKPEFAGEKWARPAGHKSEKVTCYGPVDFRGNHWGGCNYTLDVTGGWYDAGDHGKYVVNGGISVWTLLNYYERSLSHVPAYEAFADGKVKIPENANGKNDLLDEARFELDFLMAMQVPEGKTLRLPLGDQRANITALKFTEVDASGMAHHKVHDEKWTPIPQRPWEDTGKRFLSYPSTTATLNLAAVTAQCARLFRGVDDAYAAKCLKVSRRAYAAAKRVPNAYAIDVINGGGGGYGDGNVVDEFYWAASELYLTTGEAAYKNDIEVSPYYLSNAEFNWGSVPTLGTLSMTVARQTPEPLRKAARAKVVEAADQYLNARTGQGYHIPYNRPYRWGSNGDFANHGIMLALAHDFTGQVKYRNGATDLMDYMLGRNPVDMSYVSGYGTRAMQHPHHRFWAHSKDKTLPPPPPGVLAGGPQKGAVDTVTAKISDCEPQACYVDHVDSYTMNEVTINWNAPFFWLAAWLDDTKPLK